MAASSATQTAKTEANALQEQAQRHLWMHFTQMGSFGPEHEVPIIVRGDGCYVWDDHGNRYLDGLLGPLLRQLRTRPQRAGRRDGGSGPRARLHHRLELRASTAIELATRISHAHAGRPGTGLFTNSGSEAIESAIKLARSYHRAQGKAQKTKLIARDIAYHGTTSGRPQRDRHPRPPHPVRAARTGRPPRAQHEQLPLAR
jgi:adenosylmethionine-8-amino-7-oxononanoate aminotransferase